MSDPLSDGIHGPHRTRRGKTTGPTTPGATVPAPILMSVNEGLVTQTQEGPAVIGTQEGFVR